MSEVLIQIKAPIEIGEATQISPNSNKAQIEKNPNMKHQTEEDPIPSVFAILVQSRTRRGRRADLRERDIDRESAKCERE